MIYFKNFCNVLLISFSIPIKKLVINPNPIYSLIDKFGLYIHKKNENIIAYTIIPNTFDKNLFIIIISKSLESFMRYWANFMKFSSSL